MNEKIKAIAEIIGTYCCDCVAEDIYTAHVKPLECAIDRLEVDFGAYVYHTTNGHLSKPYDVEMLKSMHDEAVSNEINEAISKTEGALTKAEVDKAVLVDALEEIIGASHKYDTMHATLMEHEDIARAALARVMGDV